MVVTSIEPTLLDRSMSLLGNVTDATLHGIVELEGRVDAGRLERALRLLLEMEPVLGCRFVAGHGAPRFERRRDLDGLSLCRVREVSSPVEGLEAGLGRAVDPTADPLISVTLLRGEKDLLWLRLSHLVGDGAGARDCLYHLAALTQELQRDPDFRPPSASPSRRARRGLGQVTRSLGIWDRLGMVRRGIQDLRGRLLPRAHWRMPTTPGVAGAGAAGRTHVWRHLGAEQVRAMRDYAHERRATLNDLLTAAYLRGLAAVIRPSSSVPLRLRFTVDLRRYLPGGRADAICNLSTFGFLNAGRGSERSFSELVSRVRAEMTVMKEDYLGFGETALFGTLLSAVPHAWLARAASSPRDRAPAPELLTPTFTNFGAFQPSLLAVDGLAVRSAFLLPPVMFPPGFAIAASGCGEGVTLSAGFCESAISRGRVSRFFHRMASELPGAEHGHG